MAESDDGSLSKRDAHYSAQRSSYPSVYSTRSPPNSRPASGQLAAPATFFDDIGTLEPYRDDDDDSSDDNSDDSASPAPSVPRVPHRKHATTTSRHGNAHSTRAASRSRTIEELMFAAEHRGDANPYGGTGNHPAREESLHAPVPDITALPAPASHRPGQVHPHSRLATELYTISYLIIFSILGTLARLGVQWLTSYPGAPSIFPVLWANFGGTLFMGFLSQDQRLFREEWGQAPLPTTPVDEEKAPEEASQAARASAHAKVKKTLPLYIGLATGFCGSFTSFSTFMRDVFLAFVNDLASPDASTQLQRNRGYSFMAGLAVVIITIAVSFTALKVGAHIASALHRFTPSLPFRFTRKILDPLMVVISCGAWLGAVFMAIWPPDRPGGPSSRGSWANETWRGQAIFACVFAPAGCLLRFYVSLKLNPLIPSFPLGTFAANVFGTAVLGMAYDLQHVNISTSGVGGGRVACQVLQGIMDGFDGCLTTVSTWILEIEGLKRWHAYKYAFSTIVAGVAVLVVVMGSVKWSVGWTTVACVT